MARAAEPGVAGRRLLIFDLDGTVADTSPIHAAAFEAAFAGTGVRVDYPRIAGLRTEEAVDRLLAEHAIDLDADRRTALAAAKRAEARARLAGVRALPGALAFLRTVRDTHRLAMVTSGSRATVAQTLARLGLEGWFEPLVTGDDVVHPKPHPEGFRRCLALAETAPGDALVFEDADAGIAAARAAGIEAVRIGDPARDARAQDWAMLAGALA